MNEQEMAFAWNLWSPRLASTDFVIRAALKRAKEKHGMKTAYFSVAGKMISFCTHIV